MKIAVATCNRADYSKLAPVIGGLEADPLFEVSIIVMGSHMIDDYGNTYRFIEKDGFSIDSKLHTLVRGETESAMVESMGLAMIKLPDVLNRVKPDLVMVHGDRFDAMSVAISAAVMNIRVIHLEGGEVSGTIDDVIRHSITKLSHYHICCTQAAKHRIESMCEESSRVLLAGCPAYDELIKFDISQHSLAFDKFLPGHEGVKNFILCVYHPVTTAISESMVHFGLLLDALLEFNAKTIVLFPNVDAGSKELVRMIRLRNLENNPKMFCYKHIPFTDFIALMGNCGLMVGNSSAGIRESNVFGTPVINIGSRQRGRQTGANVLHLESPQDKFEILTHIKSLFGSSFPPDFIYGDGHSVERIVKFIKSIDKNLPVQKNFTFHRNMSGNVRKSTSSESYPLYKKLHTVKLALAVDLGGSFLRVALIDDRGEIKDIRRTHMVECATERMDLIVKFANELLEHKRDIVAGIGVSTGGRVNPDTGEIIFATKVLNGWSGMALKSRLQDRLGIPCCVENDGNCAALAELHFGTSKLQDMALLHFGTGIGGGIIDDGCLVNGSNFSAGEFGHIVVDFENGPQCMCGNFGCVEAYAGGWALDKLANTIQGNCASDETQLIDQNGDGDPKIRTKGSNLSVLCEQGNEVASQHICRATKAISSALLSIYNTFNPPVVVLAGPLAPVYYEGVVQNLREKSISEEKFKVILSPMTEMSLRGAATLVLE